MAGFIQNILWNSIEGFVDAAKKTGGEYAGNALIKAGDLIEGGGRSVGTGMYSLTLLHLTTHTRCSPYLTLFPRSLNPEPGKHNRREMVDEGQASNTKPQPTAQNYQANPTHLPRHPKRSHPPPASQP